MFFVKISFFWNITLCSPLTANQCFGGTCRLRFRVKQQAKQGAIMKHLANRFTFCLLHYDRLLSLFFYPEDGGDMFLRSVGRLSTDFTALNKKM
jgi:hypothetical protein